MNTDIQDRITALTTTSTGTFNPWNDVDDPDKVDALMASMAEDGWVGAPLVVDGDNAYTGSHRIAAQARLWNREGIDVPIPVVDVDDLATEFGLSWQDIRAAEPDTNDAVIELIRLLPEQVVDYLGMDIH